MLGDPRDAAPAARRLGRRRGRRARVARDGRAVRRQPVPGADRARPAAGAARRAAGGRDARARRGSARWRRRSCSGSAPAAAARAEHAWLDGDLDAVVAIARPAYELAAARGDAWARAELAFWLWRGGRAGAARTPDDPAPVRARDRRRLARRRRPRGAAIGYPYDRAEALSEADEEEARLEALTTFDEFGAERVARCTCGGACARTACAGSRAARAPPPARARPG